MTRAIAKRPDYAKRIRAAWQKSVEGIIETGRLLIEAKAALPHGKFEAMVEAELPFVPATARMLMAIAGHPRLAERNHGCGLPASWRSLYELTKLDDDTWALAEERKLIRPDVQRHEIAAFRREVSTASLAAAAPTKTGATNSLSALVATGARFGTVYADPPWKYGNQGTRAATGRHYETLSVDAIAALPVDDLALPNAHLHLWTTNAFLFDAKDIIEAWGFTYKSCFVWVKPQMGIGNYWRVSHEFLLLGVRGSCPFLDRSLMSWAETKRGRHSAKPASIREMVERASPAPRLEMFARTEHPGWTSWGDQVSPSLLNVAEGT